MSPSNARNSKPAYIEMGKAVVETELAAVAALKERIGAEFELACELLHACQGRVVVTGMGKSGHIGTKIAATLASTGTPSFFVHPAEASHGDLGMITEQDVVIALSNSGATEELLTLLPLFKRMGAPLIAMTGRRDSPLGQAADTVLDTSVAKEACPLNLAPTASTTVSLVMGDALAVALLEARGFTANDFAMSHPGGSLGRRLLLRVEDIMHRGADIPSVPPDMPLTEALLEMSHKGLGMTAIVDTENRVLGVFTDGDLRRALDNGIDLRQASIKQVMRVGGKTTRAELLAAEALHDMQEGRINGLLVVDAEQHLIGALNMHDMLRAKVL